MSSVEIAFVLASIAALGVLASATPAVHTRGRTDDAQKIAHRDRVRTDTAAKVGLIARASVLAAVRPLHFGCQPVRWPPCLFCFAACQHCGHCPAGASHGW